MDKELTIKKFNFDSLELNKQYPVYGMITSLLIEEVNKEEEVYWAIINYNIKARLNCTELEKLNIIKSRIYDVGIFVLTVEKINSDADLDQCSMPNPGLDIVFPIEGFVSTVVYGKAKDGYDA